MLIRCLPKNLQKSRQFIKSSLMKSLSLNQMSNIEGGQSLNRKKCNTAERLFFFGWSTGNSALMSAANQMGYAFCGPRFEGFYYEW